MSQNLKKHSGLLALFILQLCCVAFLVYDVVLDLTGFEYSTGYKENEIFEYLVVATLVCSLAATGYRVYHLISRNRNVEDQLKAASGKFAEILDQHFEDWGLTASERDVAMLAIKGLGIADIAGIRDTKEGTVKAQLNAIYLKANVSGRPQLISLFVEELMGNILTDQKTAA